ncbi:MAG: bile acid:sodium symporter family protein [Verrucomicrobia bacterium]|jgi:bile acid:Na+ symporter, BASS family|nr:bile acid:sodium symporter family protein [Verrucomicrobiota bacterium]
MRRFLLVSANWFPAWVLAAALLALWQPSLFTWFSGPWIVWGLALVMLGMGLTLNVADFAAVLRLPGAVALGFAAQYTIMPLIGWSVGKMLALPAPFAVGLILVACCPGGTASNVVTYLARGNVALSVLMTMCSTLAAVVMTPLLTGWLAGAYVPVDAWGIFLTTAQVVLAPILIGLLLHHQAPRLAGFILPAGPIMSVLVISLIVGSIIGQNATAIFAHGGQLLLAVSLLHGGGFFLGYIVGRLSGFDLGVARTLSIEVGMQNSGLGAVLAKTRFAAEPLTAVPSALSSVCHSLLGSLLAAWWRRRP